MIEEEKRQNAEQCLRVATRLYSEGKKEKALQFIDKSVRMFPTPEADVLRAHINSGASAQRPNAQVKKVPASTTNSAPKPEAAQTPRNYTPEQLEVVEKISTLNDYYSILGISKEATQDEIKRAYRKLAVKLHPDKNDAPGAEDVFKKVNQAYTCLSDKDKKAHYDLFGEEAGGGGRSEKKEDLNAEDIREMFFDPDGNQKPLPKERKKRGGLMAYAQFFPLLSLLVLALLYTLPASTPFMLEETETFNVLHLTAKENAYYVDVSFATSWAHDPRALGSVEGQVDAVASKTEKRQTQEAEEGEEDKASASKRRVPA